MSEAMRRLKQILHTLDTSVTRADRTAEHTIKYLFEVFAAMTAESEALASRVLALEHRVFELERHGAQLQAELAKFQRP